MLILSPETEAIVRARAKSAGKTPDQMIRDALGAGLQRQDAPARGSFLDLIEAADEALCSAVIATDIRPWR